MTSPTFLALALVELANVVLFGLALATLPCWHLRRVASLFPAGLLALATEALLLTLVPQRGLQLAALLATRLAAGTLLYRHRRKARDCLKNAWELAWPAATALLTLSLGAVLLASDYLQGLYLDADALAFWSLRGHFLFASPSPAGAFWQVPHPDYPILLPLLDAHGFFLAGGSGEVATAAIAYVLAFVSLLLLADALSSVVKRTASLAIPVLFLLAPVPIYPVPWRILLGGYAETWSILFVALLCRWTPSDRDRPVSWDDGLLLLAIAVLKNEGLLLALVYLSLRGLFIAMRQRASRQLRTMLRRGAVVSAPALIWVVIARLWAAESHYDYFALPSLAEAASSFRTLVDYYRSLPWVYLMIPVVLLTSLLRPGSRGRASLGPPDPLDAWLAGHAALLYGLIVSVVLLFKGPPRVVLENSFHRLHWPILLIGLIAAARMVGEAIEVGPNRRERRPETAAS